MVLGQSRGKEVRMMVHHSRNSEQKQWDETVVIALGGMARLLRAHLPAIVGMDRIAGKSCGICGLHCIDYICCLLFCAGQVAAAGRLAKHCANC